MAIYDVFNGDADGICALIQLRNAKPVESQLVTGVKRDINLLKKITPQKNDEINVLDVSFDKNRAGVEAALAAGADVFYVDHHYAGEIPDHPNLKTNINLSADVCTSLLINGALGGDFAGWAIVGAFGDNLKNSAKALAKTKNYTEQQLELLENLGIYINYNGYGSSLDDLHFSPEALYKLLSPFACPLEFIKNDGETFSKLENGYQQDMASASAITATFESNNVAVFILPNQAWARRVSGVYGNDLANQSPDKGHAVLTQKENGSYLVSVRAPLNNKTGADELCRSFETGGGRAAAAGINDLPADELDTFVQRFDQFYR